MRKKIRSIARSSFFNAQLQKLEKALVIERAEGGRTATPTGQLYLKHVEAGS